MLKIVILRTFLKTSSVLEKIIYIHMSLSIVYGLSDVSWFSGGKWYQTSKNLCKLGKTIYICNLPVCATGLKRYQIIFNQMIS